MRCTSVSAVDTLIRLTATYALYAVALVAVTVVFTIVSPGHVFLSPANLVNLFDQSAVFIVLAMGEGFVLLLGEIDLSIGYVAAIGGIVAANLVQPDPDWPWWAAVIALTMSTSCCQDAKPSWRPIDQPRNGRSS